MKLKSWDLVLLANRTDVYRVYTYKDKFIFCGINSDTVTDSFKDEVVKVLTEEV